MCVHLVIWCLLCQVCVIVVVCVCISFEEAHSSRWAPVAEEQVQRLRWQRHLQTLGFW